MTNKLLPTADELSCASSSELLDAALQLTSLAFESARTDADPLTKEELLEQVAATQRVANSALSAQAVRIAQAAGHEEVFDPDIADTKVIRHHLGFADEWIDTEIAPLLGLGPRQVGTRIQHALDAVTQAPRLITEAGSGSVDPAKIGVVTDMLAGTTTKTKRAVERALLDQGIAGLTTTQLRRRIPKLLAELEPTSVEPAAKRRRRNHIGVFSRPHHEPGLAEMVAILPTEDIAAAQRAIDEHARQLHADDTTGKTLAECRADAFIDLLLRNVHVDTTIVFHLPVRPTCGETSSPTGAFGNVTFDGEYQPGGNDGTIGHGDRVSDDPVGDELNALLDDMLGVMPDPDNYHGDDDRDLDEFDNLDLGDIGWDQLLAEARRQHPAPQGSETRPRGSGATATKTRSARSSQPARPACAASPASPFEDVIVPGVGVIPAAQVAQLARTVGTAVTRALTDPVTGTVIETMSRKYRPTAAIRRMVTTRDQHCRFPGCSMPAAYCELDHVAPWPLGETKPANLHCLCKHHHRAKHETGWRVSMTPDGVCTWTSPSGRTYRTMPAD
ncbi:MAG TPA: hypothetical protein VG502_18705 [Flexivirga sp.]|uniref:HNH endonuclease signature motif containing protein n=1 Tax=Flexivirga sp. TaxID=1962927 RepID=UPI002D046DD3|nr:hypothetical protein [Flexivirga sp.]HWC24330.1 hypothetical protein [Flexivirga sp.]